MNFSSSIIQQAWALSFSHLWKDQFQLLLLVCKLYTFFGPSLIYWLSYFFRLTSSGISVTSVSTLSFQLFTWISKFHKSGLYIITYFKHRQCSIWGILLLELIRSASITTYTCLSNFSWSQYNEVLVCKLHVSGF